MHSPRLRVGPRVARLPSSAQLGGLAGRHRSLVLGPPRRRAESHPRHRGRRPGGPHRISPLVIPSEALRPPRKGSGGNSSPLRGVFVLESQPKRGFPPEGNFPYYDSQVHSPQRAWGVMGARRPDAGERRTQESAEGVRQNRQVGVCGGDSAPIDARGSSSQPPGQERSLSV